MSGAVGQSGAARGGRWIVKRYGELVPGKAVKQKPVNAAAFNAGVKAAEDFSLHTTVEEQHLVITNQGA